MKRLLQTSTLLILFFALCALLAPLYMVLSTWGDVYSLATTPTAPVALVLGASVSSDGTLSPVLRERVDTAIALYKTHTVEKILVTGDDSTLQYDEVYPIGKYLLGAKIPQEDIFLDYAGFDTYSSMYRAKEVFGATKIIVVSQRFHLPRAVFIAHHLGLMAYGVSAGTSYGSYIYNSLREIPASVKALYDLVSHRVPKYLGPQFPLTGSGMQTWVGGEVEMIYFGNGKKH